jgi:hypothetical protein
VSRLRHQFKPLVELTHYDPDGASTLFPADYDEATRDLP